MNRFMWNSAEYTMGRCKRKQNFANFLEKTGDSAAPSQLIIKEMSRFAAYQVI